METTIEKINPKLAEEYLKQVAPGHQRKLVLSRSESFAREMVAGHWFLNHQGIAFDNNGRLIDGQHRLKAIQMSGCTVPMLVARKIASEMINGIRLYAIDTIDVGYKRQTGEQLSLRHGIENANRVAAATRTVLLWATGLSKNTTPLALEILKIYPSIKNLSSGGSNKLLPGPIVGCFAIASKAFPDLLETFIDPYISGAGLAKKSPALMLRNLVINNPCGGGSASLRFINWSMNALKATVLSEHINGIRNNTSGALFFAEQQKNNIKKIKEAAGIKQTTQEEK